MRWQWHTGWLGPQVRNDSLKRLGLDWPTLHGRFPRLIYSHLTAWGREGPDANLAGCAAQRSAA